jgi:hypothetical protein
MYYMEEDVQPAVNAAVDIFGTPGRILVEGDVLKNISIATREFGKLWYGDIQRDRLDQFSKELSGKIQKNIYVFTSGNEFIYTSAQVYKHSEFNRN